jgi:hypothetical protein
MNSFMWKYALEIVGKGKTNFGKREQIVFEK